MVKASQAVSGEIVLGELIKTLLRIAVEHAGAERGLLILFQGDEPVSSEIVLERLIDTLMRTAIEQAGAERGLLIVPRGPELRIEAEATTGDDTVEVELRDQPVTARGAAEVRAPLRDPDPRERDSLTTPSSQTPFCGG